MTQEVHSICHKAVMLNEVVEYLRGGAGGVFLDCTFGGGGHTKALLDANASNFVYAVDCDPAAKVRAQEFSKTYKQFRFYRMNFSELNCISFPALDGIIMDLGISSFQLDDADRGFSFKHHVPVDMRMDNSQGISATEFLRTASEGDLITAIRDYGEEKQWKKVVRVLLDNRKNDNMRYANQLSDLISGCLPASKHSKIHPATKTFQGIRIFINQELIALEKALPILFDKLSIGGRLAVISFHSLEDRIIKQFYKQLAGIAVSKLDNRYQQDRLAYGQILTKKPISPNVSEINYNPRSRSAKLRVLEKTKNV